MTEPEPHALAAGLSLEDQINQPHGMPFGVLLRSMDDESARAVSRKSAVDNLSAETTGFHNSCPVRCRRLWTEAQGRSALAASGGFDETTPAPSRTA